MSRDRRRRVGQVACASTRNRSETQFTSASQSDRNHPILEAQGGHVDGIILDIELLETEATRQAIGLEKRSHASADINGVVGSHGQEGTIPPNGVGTRLNTFAGDLPLDSAVVVSDFQRPKTKLTNMRGFEFILFATLLTLQCCEGSSSG